MYRILLADDHGIVRLGTSIAIGEILANSNITQSADFNEMVSHLKTNSFDLLLLDINMPGGNNIKMIEEALHIQPGLKILVYSSYDESLYALRYLQVGAAGYLSKNSTKSELQDAVLAILKKGRYMSPAIQEAYLKTITNGKTDPQDKNPIKKLSNREVDVAKYLARGMGVMEVSKTLKLSTSAVSTYKTRVFEKMQVDNLIDFIDKFRLYSGE